MIRQTWYYSMILLIFIINLATSCRQSAVGTEEPQEAVTPVTVTSVMFKSVTSAVDLPAVSIFLKKSTIRATTTGSIQEVSVLQGDYIVENQKLFSIRTRESMSLENAAGDDSTFSFKGVIKITSHEKGVITSIKYQTGDFVQEGDELATVAEQKSLAFILDVPAELDKYIERNRNCSITLPDMKIINGTITGKLPEMDLQTQTIRYIIKPFSPGRLPENLIGSVNIIKSSNEKALMLPLKAILSDETQTEFWVMKLLNDSVAIKTVVRKGIENENEVEIIYPQFHPSDRIILSGNYGLPDTAKISITQE
jgi:biotin carboxyl carrier protein